MLTVRRYGDPKARTLYVLHGGPGAAGEVGPVARRLGERFHVIEPFQRRAGGGAPLTVAAHVADLDALVLAEGAPRPAVLGHSWGAMLALAWAAAHPDHAGPLVLAGCGTFDEAARARLKATVEARTTPYVRARVLAAQGLDDPALALAEEAVATTPIYLCEPLPAEPDPADAMPAPPFDAWGHGETWADMLRLQADGTYPAAFARITSPVLMIHGDFDPHPGAMIRDSLAPFIPQLDYRELRALRPRALARARGGAGVL